MCLVHFLHRASHTNTHTANWRKRVGDENAVRNERIYGFYLSMEFFSFYLCSTSEAALRLLSFICLNLFNRFISLGGDAVKSSLISSCTRWKFIAWMCWQMETFRYYSVRELKASAESPTQSTICWLHSRAININKASRSPWPSASWNHLSRSITINIVSRHPINREMHFCCFTLRTRVDYNEWKREFTTRAAGASGHKELDQCVYYAKQQRIP